MVRVHLAFHPHTSSRPVPSVDEIFHADEDSRTPNVLFPVESAASGVRNCRAALNQCFDQIRQRRCSSGSAGVLSSTAHLFRRCSFPRDHFQQILFVAQRLSLCPSGCLHAATRTVGRCRSFSASQSRAYVGDRAHCRTAISVQHLLKQAQIYPATSTIVTGAMASSRASTSPIDAIVIKLPLPLNSSRNA